MNDLLNEYSDMKEAFQNPDNRSIWLIQQRDVDIRKRLGNDYIKWNVMKNIM